MNGSRSNTPTYGSKSSLDQLNRTIEGLEARIQGLVSDRKAPASRPYTAPANPVDEILERQRALASRERVAAAMERSPRHDTELRSPAPRAEIERPASQPPQQTAALTDIAATLAALRSEIKQGLNEGLAGDLTEIRSDMRSLKSYTAQANGGTDLIRNELARLGDSIDRLGGQQNFHGAEDLRADLDDLRAMTSRLAREDSLRNLETRWERAESKLAQMDPAVLKEELVQLAWRIDGIKSGLGELSAAPAVRALEDKLIALASTIERVGRNVESQSGLAEQFASLDHRLDEISRAIAASARQAGSSADSAALQRLESRLADLTTHIDTLQSSRQESEVAGRIEALTQRIEELANEDAARQLEDRIGQLSKLIERNFRETQAPDVSNHLADISRKIDGIGGQNTDALLDRLDHLAQRLDELEMPAESTPVGMADLTAVSRLESRLADIAARLDESVAAPAADNGALRNLETQIASLSSLLSQPNAATAVQAAPDSRILAIEDYLASSDEFIVEAARQAAEAVVEAYSRNGFAAQGSHSADISAIAGLAEDLRALEAHTRSSEERTAETFSALHQTLVQIAGRLDDLGERPLAAPVIARMVEPEPQPQPVRMPKAPQPEFAPAVEEVVHAEPVRAAAPKNPKVDVLQDEDMLVDAASDDIAAELADVVVEPKQEKPASKSLIAGLAAKLKPGKKPAAEPPRVAVDPTPALDAGDMVVAEDSSMLLEPGSGVPDVKKIMEKVRASQKSGSVAAKAPAGAANDVIAAARRAAQAAAQEAGAQKFVQPAPKAKDKTDKAAKPAKQSKSLFSGQTEVRRPILLAAAAVLLVVMSYPLVSNLIGNRQAEIQQEQSQTISTPASDDSSSAVMTPDNKDAAKTETTVQPDQPVEATRDVQLDAKPDVMPEKIDTGAKKLMTPASDPGEASVLEKSEAAPSETLVEPAKDKMAAVTMDASSPKLAEEAKQPPVDTAMQVAKIEPPAGLQPASLVEAAKKADPLAYFEIGSRYTDGRAGMQIDLASAAKWYQAAADKGLAPAQYRLASFYEKGTGVTRDLAKAKALYLSAAEKGNASAMHNLAVLYATGAAGTPDFNEAARWFIAAADHNVRDSQFNLAILYARGSGVQQDLKESYKWFGIAAKQGDQDAAQKRDEVANAMSAEQLKDAKAKLDLWTPKPLDDNANNPMVPDEWKTKSNTTASIDMKRAIRNIQAILNNNGFDAGTPDGEMGKKTVTAIKAFQKAVGQEPTGRIDDALVKELLKRNKKAA